METHCVMTQMLGLADKDFKAIVIMLKDIKENMLWMNEKTAYLSREIETVKKEPNGSSQAEKYSTQIKCKIFTERG